MKVVKKIDELKESGQDEKAEELRETLNNKSVNAAYKKIAAKNKKKPQLAQVCIDNNGDEYEETIESPIAELIADPTAYTSEREQDPNFHKNILEENKQLKKEVERLKDLLKQEIERANSAEVDLQEATEENENLKKSLDKRFQESNKLVCERADLYKKVYQLERENQELKEFCDENFFDCESCKKEYHLSEEHKNFHAVCKGCAKKIINEKKSPPQEKKPPSTVPENSAEPTKEENVFDCMECGEEIPVSQSSEYYPKELCKPCGIKVRKEYGIA